MMVMRYPSSCSNARDSGNSMIWRSGSAGSDLLVSCESLDILVNHSGPGSDQRINLGHKDFSYSIN